MSDTVCELDSAKAEIERLKSALAAKTAEAEEAHRTSARLAQELKDIGHEVMRWPLEPGAKSLAATAADVRIIMEAAERAVSEARFFKRENDAAHLALTRDRFAPLGVPSLPVRIDATLRALNAEIVRVREYDQKTMADLKASADVMEKERNELIAVLVRIENLATDPTMASSLTILNDIADVASLGYRNRIDVARHIARQPLPERITGGYRSDLETARSLYEDDIAQLRARVADLERELASRPQETPARPAQASAGSMVSARDDGDVVMIEARGWVVTFSREVVSVRTEGDARAWAIAVPRPRREGDPLVGSVEVR